MREPDAAGVRLDQVDDALAALRAGRAVIVVDDEDRENEGDFVLAAEFATPELLGLVIRHSSGMVCAPMEGTDLDRLQIPMMTARNTDPMRTAYTVTVDAATGVSTGISAADRARTGRVLADPEAAPDDLTLPGHVFPLRARVGGVLARPGHTEAAVDLTRLAGLRPVGMIAEVVNDDGSMMRAPALRRLADDHRLPMISIAQLIEHRIRYENLYAPQDDGCDTVEANLRLGLPVDSREYAVAAQILRDLGVASVRPPTNDPATVAALEAAGIRVETPESVTTAANVGYLQNERDRPGPDRGTLAGLVG